MYDVNGEVYRGGKANCLPVDRPTAYGLRRQKKPRYAYACRLVVPSAARMEYDPLHREVITS